jgi:hypothetical protein
MSIPTTLSYSPDSSFNEDPFGGYIGMSGYFPFIEDLLENVLSPAIDNDEGDPFAANEEVLELDQSPRSLQVGIANFMRDAAELRILDEDAKTLPFMGTLFILGHESKDVKVRIELGEQARDLLLKLGLDVTWKE